MRILQSWLHRYIKFTIPPDKLADRLTMLGLEFESIEDLGEQYRGFVVGNVLECSKHPQADHLSVCKVDVGTGILPIVCGGPNVAAGQKVAAGLIGATVPRDQHDPAGKPFVLSEVKIRGVVSRGMICSEYELGLGKDAEGILVLDPRAKVGQPLAEYFGLNDVAYDIEITPNRPDWLSHIGVAREIGVLVHKQPVLPRVRLKESGMPIRKHLSVTVEDKEDCPRFAVRMVRGVRIGASPEWLQRALRNAGLRPRNNVVDCTNYVMLECGHPMHAFDYARLRGGKIIVRQTRAGTRFMTLDGKEHTLQEGTVMICDAEREVSIAGVMGGANSDIVDTTVDVVLESAYWKPSSIRRTAKALGISTDASQRFERGADPHGVLFALNRAAQLVVELAGGALLKGVIDVYPEKVKERIVALRPARVNLVLGTALSTREITRHLRLLHITPAGRKGEEIRFRVPTYRVDIEREIDLIEEVARVYGYSNIDEKTTATVDFAHPFPKQEPADAVRSLLIGAGFQEAVTNSMVSEARSGAEGKEAVRILNPQNQEMATLRTSLVPGLLDVVARNLSHGNFNLRFFEIGHVFCVDHSERKKLVGEYLEEEKVCLLLTGSSGSRHWGKSSRNTDIFDLKGETENFLSKIALDKWRFISYSTSKGLTDNTLAIEINGSYAGYLGQIKADVLKDCAIEQEVFVAEIALPAFTEIPFRKFTSIPKFPRVRRDVSFFVKSEVTVQDLERTITRAGGELLQAVELFDVYQGKEVDQGKKSVAFSIELMSREKTLTDSEIDAALERIVRGVEQAFGATLRKEQ